VTEDFEILGKIVVDDQGNTSIQGLNDKLDQTQEKTSSLGTISNFVWAGVILKGIEAVVGAIGNAIGSIGEFFSSSIDSAKESQAVMANVEATVRSTGMAAGYTADELATMAEGLQNVTMFSDETILKGQAMLLTFTNIGHDILPMASEAMLDLGQKFGSVDSAAIQLGKALQDPIAGVSALRRVGVMLTEDQEEQIKKFMELGDIESAQKIILSELSTEVGGMARALGETLVGQTTIAMNKLDNFKELVGGPLLQVMSQFRLGIMQTVMGSDGFAVLSDYLTRVNGALENGVDVWSAFGVALNDLSESWVAPQFLYDLGDAMIIFGESLSKGMNVLDALNASGLLSKVGAAIAGIIDTIVNYVNDWAAGDGPQKVADALIKFIDLLFGTGESNSKILSAVGRLITALVNAIAAIPWTEVATSLSDHIVASIDGVDWAEVGDSVTDKLGTALTNAGQNIGEGGGTMNGVPWWHYIMPGVGSFEAFLNTEIGASIVNAIKEFFSGAFSDVGAQMSGVWTGLTDGIMNWWALTTATMTAVWTEFTQGIVSSVQGVKTNITDAFAGLIDGVFAALGIDKDKFIAKWQDIFNDVVLIVNEVKKRIGDAIGDFLAPIVDAWSDLVAQTQSYLDRISAAFTALKITIQGIFASLVNALIGIFSPVVDSVNKEAGKISLSITTPIQNAINTIRGFFDDMYNAGANIMHGLIQGIQAYAGQLITNITNSISMMIERVKDYLGIASPSSVFAGIGGNIVQGLINGIAGAWDAFKDWFKGLWDNLLSNLTLDNILAVIKGNMSLADLFGGSTAPPPSVGGTTGGGTGGTTGGGIGTTYIQNFYGDVYVGSMDELLCQPSQLTGSTNTVGGLTAAYGGSV
jgi:hypothetical protein